MKKILFVFTVFMIMASACKQEQAGVTLATVDQFEKAISTEGAQLIDVRTPGEYAEGHLQNAVNINVQDDDFNAKIQSLDKTKPVLVYCKAGVRSAKAASLLKEQGFTQITDLDGGITAWKYSGKKTE